MHIDKPKTRRVYLTATDPDGGQPSKSLTVYETTPEQVIKLIEDAVAANGKPASAGQKSKSKGRASAAA